MNSLLRKRFVPVGGSAWSLAALRQATGKLVVLLIGLAALALPRAGGAKLQPYYVLEGGVFSAIRPRVLLALDTSNSMVFPLEHFPGAGLATAYWNDAESEHPQRQTRIAAARRAIHQVVSATQDQVDFALMTFGQTPPPTSVPEKCTYAGVPNARRFALVHEYYIVDQEFLPKDADHYPGFTGTWKLCMGPLGGGAPYPYLRWDELGVGSMITSNNRTGAVPASPLLGTSELEVKNVANARRRVQWFPRYFGTRIQLNASTDPDKSTLARTIGDWASTAAQRDASVWGHDFYYWPYVDGFTGYSSWEAVARDPGYSDYRAEFRLGVTESTYALGLSGSLVTPFYADLSGSAVPVAERGPAARSDAHQQILWAVSPAIQGGVEPNSAGTTAWASMIGDVPATAPNTNDYGSHTSVASYLKFLQDTPQTACAPTSVIVVSDGEPSPASEAGPNLYRRLANLRNQLGAKVYVVGAFTLTNQYVELNEMACAAAGACDGTSCATPCDDVPANGWDTCADPANPTTTCGFEASSSEDLAEALETILDAQRPRELGSGQGATLHDVGADREAAPLRTTLRAYTEWPGWKGHVVREPCSDPHPDPAKAAAGEIAPWCEGATEFTAEEVAMPTGGPCARSRNWDAGVCLRWQNWRWRRVFSSAADGTRYSIYDAQALRATQAFQDELVALGLVGPKEDPAAKATAVAEFAKGRGFPDGWKLTGTANSVPLLVRALPRRDDTVAPSVGIRDPHCAGRIPPPGEDVPPSLRAFSAELWDPAAKIASPSPHYAAMDAVLVGTDLGLVHALQYDSGNELWAYVPRFVWPAVVAQFEQGTANRGQPQKVRDHIYGVGATAVSGWAYDSAAATWRHIAVLGVGPGGKEYVALDVTRTTPFAESGKPQVLWTTEDPGLKSVYDGALGETWARPALTYHVPGDAMSETPRAFLVMASGYDEAVGSTDRGRTVMLVDALTGTVVESADMHVPGARLDAAFGMVADPAVVSHCKSGFWAEMQEAYFADPGGRLSRWDLGGFGTPAAHEADHRGPWNGERRGSVTLWSCRGTGGTCAVDVSSSARKRDSFSFAPAVTALDRIDATSRPVHDGEDQVLIALNSGSPYDDSLDPDTGYHSSLYLIRDDHRADPTRGYAIPGAQAPQTLAQVGSSAGFMRVPVSAVPRRRSFRPFPGAPLYVEDANFDGTRTRPVRSPAIRVSAVTDASGALLEDVEVYTITYTLYEGPAPGCDTRWFDASTDTWYRDEGAVYEVDFRLTASDSVGFNFAIGAGGTADFGPGFDAGLTYVETRQVMTGACQDGVCSPRVAPAKGVPCGAESTEPPRTESRAVALQQSQVTGFAVAER